ncbi:MAG TPA: NAD(P)H-hydrate dehydratase, partial [Gemmatimonadaceae bacterium]|nr:NAD(P)H-hydrate dehydratase [Gemmatimonadaceae bacterium]
VASQVPSIPANAHKGIRMKLAIIGGAKGMAGATVLAARAALRSGIGMVKIAAADESIAAIQASEAAVMCARWPQNDDEFKAVFDWANVVLVGPGLGLGAAARAFAERVLDEWRGPVVVDADALTAFSGRAAALGALLEGRPAVITPHAVEFSRIAGVSPDEVNSRRFEIAGELARAVHATVLLKGVPTIVSDGIATDVSASGTPVLATGGSGDVLGGMVATLLAQGSDARSSAAAAAWVHGRAAEIAGAGQVRGVNLNDVIESLREAWRLEEKIVPAPILAELAAVGESR